MGKKTKAATSVWTFLGVKLNIVNRLTPDLWPHVLVSPWGQGHLRVLLQCQEHVKWMPVVLVEW